MKILQVNCVYAKGSTGKIVRDIHKELQARGEESVVCYGRGEKQNQANIYKTCSEAYSKANNLLSRFTGIMYGGCRFSTERLISIIQRERPDIVHLHCLNGYFVDIYGLLEWLKKNRIRTVLTLHAEFMYTGGCGSSVDCEQWKNSLGCGSSGCPRWHTETKSLFFDRTNRMWKMMKGAFDGFDGIQIVGVSDWISNRARISPVLSGHRITTIHNGIDLRNFSAAETEEDSAVLRKYGLPPHKKVIVHVTPSFSNPVKGGEYFLQLVKQLGEEYQAVVVGCESTVSDGIISIPFVSDQRELAAIYRQASVMVITSIADNYPTVCIEANCCGTPVVGFDVGGVAETIGKDMGETVSPFRVSELADAVAKWSARTLTPDQIEAQRESCDSKRMTEDYCELYLSLLRGQ